VAALCRFGLPIGSAIAGATGEGAAAVGMELGLEVGAPADLVAYDGDPLDDPTLLERPSVVVAGGVLVTDRR
jgi:imidazolonepropionase-like amidohydrolase